MRSGITNISIGNQQQGYQGELGDVMGVVLKIIIIMQFQEGRDVSSEPRVKIRKIGPYILIKPIGKGSYSTVYEGKLENSETKVAIKQIALEKVSKKDLQRLQFQMKILTLIKHQNIVNLLDHKESERNIYLIFEHCQHTDLEKHIKKYYKGKMPEANVKKVFLQIKKAFQVLRTNKIVHRDLKLANILLTEDFTIKVADFGFAKLLEDNSLFKSVVGTPLTMAPEVLEKRDYDQKCDIWSLGIILYQMLFGKSPFVDSDHMTVEKLKENIRTMSVTFDEEVLLSEPVKNLILRMLVKDPKERMNFEEFFNHDWLQMNQCSEVLTELREAMLEKQVSKSIRSKSNKPDMNMILKYLDKMLVFKLFLTIKEQDENCIYASFSLAKRLIALAGEDNDPLVKEIMFVGLLILLNNIKETEEKPQPLLLNNVPILMDGYNLIKQIKVPEQTIFSQTLSGLAKKTIFTATQTLQALLSTPFIKNKVSDNNILLRQYTSLIIKYLEASPKKELLGVLSDIRPHKFHRLKLSSELLSKETIKIINKPKTWHQLLEVQDLVKDSEFLKIYNSKKKWFKIEVMDADKHSEEEGIEEFYQALKELV